MPESFVRVSWENIDHNLEILYNGKYKPCFHRCKSLTHKCIITGAHDEHKYSGLVYEVECSELCGKKKTFNCDNGPCVNEYNTLNNLKNTKRNTQNNPRLVVNACKIIEHLDKEITMVMNTINTKHNELICERIKLVKCIGCNFYKKDKCNSNNTFLCQKNISLECANCGIKFTKICKCGEIVGTKCVKCNNGNECIIL